MNRLVVPKESDGQRIDVFLAFSAEDVPTRSAAQKIIDAGFVLVGGKKAKKRLLVKPGDEIFYGLPAPESVSAEPEDIPLDIVYEDCDIIVVNKQKGMVVHPAPGHYTGTLVNALLFYTKNELSSLGGEMRPGLVHRLDKDTSGLLVVAKNETAHAELSAQFKSREIGRVYNAICQGIIKEDTLEINQPIARHKIDRKKMAVNPQGKPAVTIINVIERFPKKKATFLVAKLTTGRTHQIRVHLSHINHPVLGDGVYGTGKENGTGQILHAKTLRLIHPGTKKPMEFDTPLPEYFEKTLSSLSSR